MTSRKQASNLPAKRRLEGPAFTALPRLVSMKGAPRRRRLPPRSQGRSPPRPHRKKAPAQAPIPSSPRHNLKNGGYCYCWTHGLSGGDPGHPSRGCMRPNDGHEIEATMDNPLGGSKKRGFRSIETPTNMPCSVNVSGKTVRTHRKPPKRQALS